MPSSSATAWRDGQAWCSAALGAPAAALLPALPVPKLLTLFVTFLKLGAVSFGTGYVLFAFLHAEFVDGLRWLSEQQHVDAVAISQATR